ncbi:uncharacterized protein LOC113206618 [Frankliniella occidentalis]|uniref:Uncharacterized protein LOC113206618 n=1 Tax=Frankliniella occidentalis TaxID=133901 RepID=A0A9C6U2S5_FRAOC|nr:uncharacterized protein LOC113206618 [Frankliniella occidentalis]
MARPPQVLPLLLPLLLLLLLLDCTRCRMIDVNSSTSESRSAASSSPSGATATTTERVMVVTARSVDLRKSRTHWPHASPVTALHAFSSSAADGDDWTAGVAKRDVKQDAPWQQRLLAEDAAVLQWKRAEDEKSLQQQEKRVNKERFVVGGAPSPSPSPSAADDVESNTVDDGPALHEKGEGGVRENQGAVKHVDHDEAVHGEDAEPAPAPTRKVVDSNARVRTLLAELQEVMQKYLRRSHRKDRRYEDADDNSLRPGPYHGSTWWPRSEDLMRASLRVLVACRQGLDRQHQEHGDDVDDDDDLQGSQDPRNLLARLRECLRGRLLAAVDNLVAADTVPIAFGVSLVRRHELRPGLIRPGRVGRDSQQDAQEVAEAGPQSQALAPRLLSRLGDLFATHDLRIGYGAAVEEGRRRHQYRKVFPVLVTGFMILMSLMVPLGFQFMAMIGGKALLMSKMALIMASMYNFRSQVSQSLFITTNCINAP